MEQRSGSHVIARVLLDVILGTDRPFVASHMRHIENNEEVRMRRVDKKRVVPAVTLGTLVLLLSTGCSFDFSIGGDVAVAGDEVARQASAVLEQQVGYAPDDITCPEDLPAEVGSSIRCELSTQGQTYGVTVTTTSVEGTDVEFDIVVDDAPTG